MRLYNELAVNLLNYKWLILRHPYATKCTSTLLASLAILHPS